MESAHRNAMQPQPQPDVHFWSRNSAVKLLSSSNCAVDGHD